MRLALALVAAAALSFARTTLPEDPAPSRKETAVPASDEPADAARARAGAEARRPDGKALPFDDGSKTRAKKPKALPFDDGSKARAKKPKALPFDDGSKPRARPGDDAPRSGPRRQ